MPAYAPLLEDLRDYLDPKPFNSHPKVFMTWGTDGLSTPEDRNLATINKWLAGQITDAELYAQIEVTE